MSFILKSITNDAEGVTWAWYKSLWLGLAKLVKKYDLLGEGDHSQVYFFCLYHINVPVQHMQAI